MYRMNKGPEKVDFHKLKELRDFAIRFGARPLIRKMLVIEPPTINEKRNKRTGEITGESISGGPYIEIPGFRYRYTSSKGEEIDQSCQKASIFTWTSKMSCASFSVPAGPLSCHGTCLASDASIVERSGSYTQYGHPPLSEMPEGEDYICNYCYAGKGNYRYPSTCVSQMLKRMWLDMVIGSNGQYKRQFVSQMIRAIQSLFEPETASMLRSKGISNKYFRIHDSGDYYNRPYYEAWNDICRYFEGKILFWAPTRMWVFPAWVKTFREMPPPSNLTLRPSALFTSAPPPRVPGMHAGTVSIKVSPPPKVPRKRVRGNPTTADMIAMMPESLVSCPAYKNDIASCSGSRCRRCWSAKGIPIDYETH